MAFDFEQQLRNDAKDVFLAEFSHTAIYKSGVITKEVKVQFFEEPLDKTQALYHHAWCSHDDIPLIANGHTLEILGVVYGVVDFSADEHQIGINLFLQKV